MAENSATTAHIWVPFSHQKKKKKNVWFTSYPIKPLTNHMSQPQLPSLFKSINSSLVLPFGVNAKTVVEAFIILFYFSSSHFHHQVLLAFHHKDLQPATFYTHL